MSLLVSHINIEKSDIEKWNSHDYMCDDYIIGMGGGKHIVYGQWWSKYVATNLYDPDLFDLRYLITEMMNLFKWNYPNLIVNRYWIEHRAYHMDQDVFVGNQHNDASNFTIICYYEIGTGIIGGHLKIYDYIDPSSPTISCVHEYVPIQGDIIIFSGVHQVDKLHATKESIEIGQNRRSMLTIFISC
jgi:hypothetical protein